MEILNKIIEAIKAITAFLEGYKTYIIGLVIVIEGLVRGDMQTVLIGLGFITGRQAVGKIETNLGMRK